MTEQKVLTQRAQATVQALHRAGVRFAITSGRPPRGMAMLFDALDLDTPIAGFNAGHDVTRKPVVMSLIAKLGFEAIDAGPLRIAHLLEADGMLWIDQALNRRRGRKFAFAITNQSGC